MELLIAFFFGAKLYYSAPVVIDPIREQMLLLALCESTNNPEAINYNDGKEGSHSYGKYQLKIPTAQFFAKKYDIPIVISEENIKDETLQDVLVYQALKDNQHRHWRHCSRKYGWIE